MKKLFMLFFLLLTGYAAAFEVKMEETADSEQIYGNRVESETLLSMNDMDVEYGYVLYQTTVSIESAGALLEVENIRDYAAVYLDEKFQGVVTDNRKKIALSAVPGEYILRLYVENIGRITYGPEILDNSKGLFGTICIDAEAIENWQITELKVRNADIRKLKFSNQDNSHLPCFRKAYFKTDNAENLYLDISGWGMGEVWINGRYLGSYWEEEKQQSISVPASILKEGENELVVFELKNDSQQSMRFSKKPVFK